MEVLTMSVSRLKNRNVVAGRGRTSIRLEPEFWDALGDICRQEGTDTRKIIRGIEDTGADGGRTSSLRVFILNYFRNAGEAVGYPSHRLTHAEDGQRHAVAMAAGGD